MEAAAAATCFSCSSCSSFTVAAIHAAIVGPASGRATLGPAPVHLDLVVLQRWSLPPVRSVKWKCQRSPFCWRLPAFFDFGKGLATSYTTPHARDRGGAWRAAVPLLGELHCPASAVFFARDGWRSGEVVVAIWDDRRGYYDAQHLRASRAPCFHKVRSACPQLRAGGRGAGLSECCG